MLMVIDDATKKQSYFWIYQAGANRFQIYGRIDGGNSRVLVTCETREEAERWMTTPEKRATLITFH